MLEGVPTIQSGWNIFGFQIFLACKLPNSRLGAFSLRLILENTKICQTLKRTNCFHASKEYWAEFLLRLVDVALRLLLRGQDQFGLLHENALIAMQSRFTQHLDPLGRGGKFAFSFSSSQISTTSLVNKCKGNRLLARIPICIFSDKGA